MGKLDVSIFKYLSLEDIRVLIAVSKNVMKYKQNHVLQNLDVTIVMLRVGVRLSIY